MSILLGLSPSAQGGNPYAAGLGNEKQRMDQLAGIVLSLLKPLERTGLHFDAYLGGKIYSDNVSVSNARGWTHHLAIHTNANASSSDDVRIPVMAFWYPTSVQGKSLAMSVANAIAKVNPYGLGSCYPRSDLAELKNTNAKAALVELREHDTVSGANDIVNHMDAYARAVAQGIVNYLNTEYQLGLTLSAPVVVTDPLSNIGLPVLRKGMSGGVAGKRLKVWMHAMFSYASNVDGSNDFIGDDAWAAMDKVAHKVTPPLLGPNETLDQWGPKCWDSVKVLGFK